MKFQVYECARAVSFALLAMSISAQAQETLRTEEVRVTASRVEQELLDVPMSVSVVTKEEIERSNAKTVGDVLKNVPGVRVMNDGSQGMKRIQIRGEDAFRTVVMIDGQRIAEHKSMSGAPILIDPSMIERIEVIKGPASVLYGSDAIGGAVNIITKKGGERPVEGEISAGMTSGNSGTSLSGSIFGAYEGWEYRVAASHEKAGNLHTPFGEVENTDFSAKNASLYVAYNFTEDLKAGVTLDHYDLDFNTGLQDMAAAGYDDFLVAVPEWKRTKAGAFVEAKNLTENLVRVRADAFYQKSDKWMHNRVWTTQSVTAPVYTGKMNMKMDNYADNELDQYGVAIQTDWQLGDLHYLIAGYEFNYDDLEALTNTHSRQNWTPDFAMSPDSNKRKLSRNTGYQQMHAVYAAMESLLPADFTLNYGARYTWVESEVKTWEGETPPSTDLTSDPGTPRLAYKDKKSSNDGRAVFNLGTVWRGIEHTALRATWAQGFRAPNLMERYIPTSMGGGNVVANPDLEPERSNNYEIGARFTPGRAVLDVAVFYSDADNYIATFEVQSKTYMNKNVAGAKTHGIEIEASYRFENGFEPYVNGTWMRRKFEQDGHSTYDSGTPELYGRYGVRWFGELQGASLRTDFYAVSQSETAQYDFDSKETTGYAGSTYFNLEAGVAFGPQNAYSFDVGLYNITDKAYKLSDAIYEPGRYFAAKFNAKF